MQYLTRRFARHGQTNRSIRTFPHARRLIPTVMVILLTSTRAALPAPAAADSTARYLDSSDGRDWPGYGRTFGQQHYSPLVQIDQTNVDRLGLAWSMDLEPLKNSATQPIAVDGVLY